MIGQCMKGNGTRAKDMARANGANQMVQSTKENTSLTRCGESVRGGRVTGMFMRAGTKITSGDYSTWEVHWEFGFPVKLYFACVTGVINLHDHHREGFGKYTAAHGESYEGEWQSNLPHGQVTIVMK